MIDQKLVKKWLHTKALLDMYKKDEMDLRKQIVAYITEGQVTPKTYKAEAAYGTLTATLGTNFRIDMDVYNQIERKLKPNELDCIKLDPKLKLNEFKLLDAKSLLRKAVIETPGAPTLKFKPKEEE